MKKYLYTALLGIALASLLGCDKLNVTPKDEISDKKKAYSDVRIAKHILSGIYSLLINEDTWGALLSIRTEAATDASITRTNAADSPENFSQTSQSSQIFNMWMILYKGINAANEYLYYSPLYTPKNASKDQMIGEAKFLRAWFYFTLVRCFGDVPFYTKPTQDIYHTDIERTSAVDIYHFIVSELYQAQELLGEPQQMEYGRVNKTVAWAALADVYLNMGGILMVDRMPSDSTQTLMYERSASWSEKVLASSAHDITATQYVDIFQNQVRNIPNLKEQVWELQPKYMVDEGYRIDTRLGKYNGMGYRNQPEVTAVYMAGGYVYHTPLLRNIFGKLNAADMTDDKRMDWNCPLTRIAPGSRLGAPVYEKINPLDKNIYQLFPGKWRMIFSNTIGESTNINYSGARLSMYRIADVHLMYAEAVNLANNDQNKAISHINTVRSRSGASQVGTGLSQEEVFELIVDERLRELCFEGKRYFDLVRWGLLADKIQELQPYYDNPSDRAWVTAIMTAMFRNFDPERNYIMPIPQHEIDNNALIPQSDQNQGWGGTRRWK